MIEFTLFIAPLCIVCESGRAKGSRLIAQGGGLAFYAIGKVTPNIDQVCNVIANKEIEMNGRSGAVRIIGTNRNEKVVDVRQLKLL